MKKMLRYCGLALIGFFFPIIVILSVMYFYDIDAGDIVVTTESILTRLIDAWNLDDSERPMNKTDEKTIYNPKQSKKMVHLYFADETDRYLKVEDRIVAQPESPCQFARILLNALFDGPNDNLNPVLPKENFLRALYIDYDSHTAFVDLNQTIGAHLPGGVTQELLTIYAIVNTLTLNIRDVEQVKITIGGQEAYTLNGHLDIRYPYTTNMLIVR
ncbi:MAG: spore germination protein [Candidatus Magnetoglobus multicellularis str. Araruama]|uniref:Spore germination protein n=1 Tax=Candidatus Magnetoglobus multicellularis str. Araruama TaxID=890399 RepID=A0A1V1P654_9BACT|nr:MAG: spore germination protein [Candidatus Magnetoglobus multicellularis str. Araruama]